jgi:uncharacterized membrane protein YuzA (DUF378 family)
VKGVIALKKLVLVLLIIGGLNWGLIGLFNYNLVDNIFGTSLELISRIIYTLVGLAGLWAITFLFDSKREG